MSSTLTKTDIETGLRKLGVTAGMALEVHSSLGGFGYIEGGAKTLIEALIAVVGDDGAIVMPSFRHSRPLPLNEIDNLLGLTLKIRLLEEDEEPSGMGIVSDTFRKTPGVITGQGLFRVSAWGKEAEKHARGFQYLIDIDGWALLLGVDIYSMSSMHYVEDILPTEIRNKFKPSEGAFKLYPEGQWFIEAWKPPVKPWHAIQATAYQKGFIRDVWIGRAKCMLLKIRPVIVLYREALQNDPFGLYGQNQL